MGQSAAHLNGLEGTCGEWDGAKGRWTVKLTSGEDKSIKQDNLEAIVASQNSQAGWNESEQDSKRPKYRATPMNPVAKSRPGPGGQESLENPAKRQKTPAEQQILENAV